MVQEAANTSPKKNKLNTYRELEHHPSYNIAFSFFRLIMCRYRTFVWKYLIVDKKNVRLFKHSIIIRYWFITWLHHHEIYYQSPNQPTTVLLVGTPKLRPISFHFRPSSLRYIYIYVGISKAFDKVDHIALPLALKSPNCSFVLSDTRLQIYSMFPTVNWCYKNYWFNSKPFSSQIIQLSCSIQLRYSSVLTQYQLLLSYLLIVRNPR